MQPDLFGATPQPEQITAGVDEAGRGPLAGAVYAAAVILDPARPIEGLADSKALKPARREALALEIRERALAWFIASASVQRDRQPEHPARHHVGDAARGAGPVRRAATGAGGRQPGAQAGLHGADRDQGRRPGAGDLGRVHPGQDRPRRGPAAPARAISAICLRSAQGLRHGAAPAAREHGPCAEHRRSFAPIKAFGADA